MENNRISIRNGAGKIGYGDRRCRRANCVFPNPMVQFDFGGRRLVAVWNWLGVGVASDTNRVKITMMPTMLLVAVSYN